MFTATTKAIGRRHSRNGKAVRVYDKPRTPYLRVIDSAILSKQKRTELAALFEDTNPAELTRRITDIQTRLINLAAAKTDVLTHEISRAKSDEASSHLSRAS